MSVGMALLLFGVINGLYFAPPDYQQSDAFRIIYVHVPAAYISMMTYSLMAIASIIGLIWRIKIAFAFTSSAASLALGSHS